MSVSVNVRVSVSVMVRLRSNAVGHAGEFEREW